MNSFYGKKISVHISLSSIPTADWSQLDSPTVLMTLVMVSSTKTHTVFPAIFMSAPAFMVQAAPSLHPSRRQPSCGHGEYFLPASASSAANVSVSLPLSHSSPLAVCAPDQLAPQSWRGSSFWLFRALGFLCWEPRRTLRKQIEQLCLPFIGSPQEADEWR